MYSHTLQIQCKRDKKLNRFFYCLLISCHYISAYTEFYPIKSYCFSRIDWTIREIKIHVYAKRQTWICTTWPSFQLNCHLLLRTFYSKINTSTPGLSIRIVSDSFYLLTFYFEKFQLESDVRRRRRESNNDPTSTPHPPYIDPTTTHIDLTSTLHRPHIDPTSTLQRPYIDPTSTPHRTHIDPTSKQSKWGGGGGGGGGGGKTIEMWWRRWWWWWRENNRNVAAAVVVVVVVEGKY